MKKNIYDEEGRILVLFKRDAYMYID